MPPRHTYWTIILEGKPTAFRAHTREELAPTLRQLQARHPGAVLMWFARGRLWESQEQERAANTRGAGGREKRGAGWRPGGSHEDPRARFKIPREEKRRRFADRARRDRFDKRDGPPAWNRDRKPPRPTGPRPEWGRDRRDERPGGPARRPDAPEPSRPGGDRPDGPGRPARDRRDPRHQGERRPGGKDFRPAADRPRGPGRPPRGPRDERPQGPGRQGSKDFRPGGDRPRGPGRPPGGPRSGGERQGSQNKRDWKPDRPDGGKGGQHRARRPFRPTGGRGPGGGSDRRGGGGAGGRGGRRGGGGGGRSR